MAQPVLETRQTVTVALSDAKDRARREILAPAYEGERLGLACRIDAEEDPLDLNREREREKERSERSESESATLN